MRRLDGDDEFDPASRVGELTLGSERRSVDIVKRRKGPVEGERRLGVVESYKGRSATLRRRIN